MQTLNVVDIASLSSLTKELKRLGVDTTTPGLKAEERRKTLTQRYMLHGHNSRPGFVPPPPVEEVRRNQNGGVPPPPEGIQFSRQEVRVPPPPRAKLPSQSMMMNQNESSGGLKAGSKNQLEVRKQEQKLVVNNFLGEGRTNTRENNVEAVSVGEFRCEHCGKSFKNVSHLIVHSRTHKRQSSKEKSSLSDGKKQEKTDALWIETFAKSLYDMASSDLRTGRLSGAADSKSFLSSLDRQSSPSLSIGVLDRRNTMPALGSKFVPPPPKEAPPAHLLRSKSMSSFTPSAIAYAERRHRLREEILALEGNMHSLRNEFIEMTQLKEATLRRRLVEEKEVELQEVEWELEQVQAELRRVEVHPGLFIDSSLASKSGRIQRWAKEDLANQLTRMEADFAHRIRKETGRIRMEADQSALFGTQAQERRKVAIDDMERRLESLRREEKNPEPPSTTSEMVETRSAKAIGQDAVVLHMKHRKAREAEELYLKSLEIDPSDPIVLGNYALFLSESWTAKTESVDHREPGSPVQHPTRNKEADKYFRVAIQKDPSNGNNLSNYATFLKNNMKDYDRAEQYFQRACRSASQSAGIVGNFASFLFQIRKDIGRADRMFRRALELDPSHVNNLCHYASVLKGMGKFDQAESMYRRALQVDAKNATVLCNYANLVAKTVNPADMQPENLQRVHKSQELYLQALNANPRHKAARRNYMILLRDFPSLRTKENETFFQATKSQQMQPVRSRSQQMQPARRRDPSRPQLENIIE